MQIWTKLWLNYNIYEEKKSVSPFLRIEMGFYLQNHESLHPRMIIFQVWLKFAKWFWRRFLNFVKVFSLFYHLFTLEKDVNIHLYELESPLPKDVLCHVWLKLAWWFWRFLNFDNIFSLFCFYLPVDKWMALHLNKIESPYPNLVEIGQWFRKRR